VLKVANKVIFCFVLFLFLVFFHQFYVYVARKAVQEATKAEELTTS
jgi:hypothetical protein